MGGTVLCLRSVGCVNLVGRYFRMKLQLLRPPLALSRAKQSNVATTHLEYTAGKYLEI